MSKSAVLAKDLLIFFFFSAPIELIAQIIIFLAHLVNYTANGLDFILHFNCALSVLMKEKVRFWGAKREWPAVATIRFSACL